MKKARDPGAWMWVRARQLLEEAEHGHRRFSDVPSWEPAVDVFETPTEMWVLVAVPGVDPGTIEIELEESFLVIRGSRSVPPAFRRSVVHRMEIPTGPFERSLSLPSGPYELRTRDSVNGCILVSLAKPR
jgi:HSP20 family molecular chaperone IbpA